MRRAVLEPTPQATADRLLDAAEGVFARAGFDGARLEDVAAAVGIRRPSLLHHFPTKAALHEAVVRRAFEALGRALLLAMAADLGASPEERLDAVVAAWLGFLRERPAFAPLLLREVLDGRGPGRELLLRHAVPLLDGIEAWVERVGLATGSLQAPARTGLLAIVTSSLVRAASGPLERPLWGAADDTAALARALVRFDLGPPRGAARKKKKTPKPAGR